MVYVGVQNCVAERSKWSNVVSKMVKACLIEDGKYNVFSDGRVWSNIVNRFMAYDVNSKGYHRVGLIGKMGRKHVTVHRLVAQCFLKNVGNKAQVNHIDGDKLNNDVGNLEWCSNSENMRHAWRTGLTYGSTGKTWKWSPHRKRKCV